MSVIVKHMKRTKNCNRCRMRYSSTGYAWCDITGASLALEIDMRDYTCPLVEIPTPHGRLVDLDALYEEISNGNKAYNGIDGYDGEYLSIANVDDCLDAIKYADTVIEAEGSET